MPIITITSDMGLKDHYVAALKGVIFSHIPNATIVDVSHHVKPFDIVQGTYELGGVLRRFPANTIHLLTINPEPSINAHQSHVMSIMQINNQWVIANDNGCFELILKLDFECQGFWRIDDAMSRPENLRFPIYNCAIPAAKKLAENIEPDEFATKASDWYKLQRINPIIEENLIKGTIVHFDYFGNAITNIHKSLFERFPSDVPFTIIFRGKEYFIDKIHTSYTDVHPGERIALFNHNDWLEIAISKGSNQSGGGANSLFGLHLGDTVRIEFNPRGSVETFDKLFS